MNENRAMRQLSRTFASCAMLVSTFFGVIVFCVVDLLYLFCMFTGIEGKDGDQNLFLNQFDS